MREAAVVRMPRVQRLSLSAIGTPSERRRRACGRRDRAPRRAPARARPIDRVERVQMRVVRRDAVERLAADIDRRDAARVATASRISRRVGGTGSSAEDPRHLEEPASRVGVGRLAERRRRGQRRAARRRARRRAPRTARAPSAGRRTCRSAALLGVREDARRAARAKQRRSLPRSSSSRASAAMRSTSARVRACRTCD